MIATTQSALFLGVHAHPVRVETDIAEGLPQFVIVGLPDTSIKESRERVKSAIKNAGYHFPSDKITVNLAPAEIKKEGAAFDLSIAIGILAASGIIPEDSYKNIIFLGELALDGSLRPVKGIVIMASDLSDAHTFIIPAENAREAALVSKAKVIAATHLREVLDHLKGSSTLPVLNYAPHHNTDFKKTSADFSEVRGQRYAKRAIEVAVAGGHNLLLIGPPGAGKTMLARRIPSILPPLSYEEALEVTKIYSATGLLSSAESFVSTRPFRSPHHTASAIALVGGGAWPKPGEVSLSHHGVLFLDEFPEFRRDVMESLRNPLEDGEITVSRARHQITYPCKFMLTASMNPCQCGYLSDPRRACRCSLAQIYKYQSKVSGPILDRMDLHIEVPALPYQHLIQKEAEESSEQIRERVMLCREIQRHRFKGLDYQLNSRMRIREIKKWAAPCPDAEKLLEAAMKELRLSARAYFKILKVARTIADLGESEIIESTHIAEAIQYRSLDRQWRT